MSVTPEAMRQLEQAAIAAGWSEESLMDLAGRRLAAALAAHFPRPGTMVGYLGKGHNAGDAWIALRILRDDYGWEVRVRTAFPPTEWAELSQRKARDFGDSQGTAAALTIQDCRRPIVLLDALLGIGARGEPREPLVDLIGEINALRDGGGVRVVGVDGPTGVCAATGRVAAHAVVADVSFVIGAAKCGLLDSQAANHVGSMIVVPVEPLAETDVGEGSCLRAVAPQTMRCGKTNRRHEFHKGEAGRVSVHAGSMAYSGAAALAAIGALRGGAGLVTLHVPVAAESRIAIHCPPEVIVQGHSDLREGFEAVADAHVVGCGWGPVEDGLADCIIGTSVPTVVDADGLNLLARCGRLAELKPHHVITPHPGEFARLFPELAGRRREEAVCAASEQFSGCLLLKGARTLVTRRHEGIWCNTTGTPAMASGGQGDLLAGVVGALAASQDFTVPEAAAVGAWLCGRAAELALDGRFAEESLLPSDVAGALGQAFHDWKTNRR